MVAGRGLIAGVLISAMFAGCFAAEDATEQGGSDPVGDADATTGDVTPPAAFFTIEVDGNVTEAANGSIPLLAGVNVTFNASASTGTGLQFGWDFGDNSTMGLVPDVTGNASSTQNATGNASSTQNATGNATGNETAGNLTIVEHAFEEAGSYNVTLYVTDATGQVATAMASVTVSPSGPPSGTWLREDKKSYSIPATNLITSVTTCATKVTDWVFVEEEANGTASVVGMVVFTATYASTGGVNNAVNLYFLAPDGKTIDSKTSGTGAKTINKAGPFPAGKYQVKLEICTTGAAVQASASGSGTVTYVVP